MKIDWLTEAAAIAEELYALRRDFHMHPERGNHEFRTAAAVEEYLHSCGIETQRCTESGVIGVLRGAYPGETVALRADMDALPIQEASGASFASCQPGCMHACGHDVHTAAALGAASLLSKYRQHLCGTVKFFFQPDEEESGGARRMIDAGCMSDPPVSAVFGAHVAPDLPKGSVGIRFGKFYAASDVFDVTVTGKSAHGAQPEKGIDALAAAAAMISALKELPLQFPNEKSVLSVGSFHSGTVRNVIADQAVFSGIIRTLGADTRLAMRSLFTQCLRSISDRFGTKLDIELRGSYPGIVNSDDMSVLAMKATRELLGSEKIYEISEATMTSEDFGYFVDAAKGSFYHIGVGGDYPLHSNRFLPDETVIPLAAAVHAAVLSSYLGTKDVERE